MSGLLHITNGDVAAGLLRRSDVSGTVLPWRDALHEGPVPAGLSQEDLDEIRASFIESAGWSAPGFAAAAFAERRSVLLHAATADEVVLWFEHDLYDQLQLLQIVDHFAETQPRRLTLIEVGEFPGIEKFVGLGQLSPSQLSSLFGGRREVTAPVSALAQEAWAAFTSDDPRALEALLKRETFALPFLQDALIRMLEEYPGAAGGLGRTERQALEAAVDDRTLGHLFHAAQRREERAFMGDTVLKWRLKLLSDGPAPLLTGRSRRLSFEQEAEAFWGQEAVLTPAGRSVLDGREDAVRLRGIDRWFGGVHMKGRSVPWRWDPAARKLVAGAAVDD